MRFMKTRKPLPVVPEYDKTHVGRRFLALRLTRGMTQVEWANAIGEKCTPQKIWNYEKGQDQVPINYAARACILTGANFDFIYRGMVGGLSTQLLRQLRAIEVPQPPRASPATSHPRA